MAAILLIRVPAHAQYATDLLPALILAGIAGGLSAPAVQIGALSGVPQSMTGLAGGLVETLREIGGAVGVALVATVLVSHADNSSRVGNSATHGLAEVNAYHAAFWVMLVAAALGVLTAAVAFPRTATQHVEVERPSALDPMISEPDVRV